MAKGAVETPLDALTYKIIGCAMALHRELGPGLREDTYQRGLETRLSESGLAFESQQLLEVHADGTLVGYYVPDLVVEGAVVVEIKALDALDNAHLAQVISYLAITGCKIGLLVNFGARSLGWRRIFPPRAVTAHQANQRWLFVPDWMKISRGDN
jgi:GxxExxY protein